MRCLRSYRQIALTGLLVMLASSPASAAMPARVIELVSTPDKSVPVLSGMLSDDGERVLYRVWGGTPGTEYGSSGALLARRTPSGWQSTNPLPPRSVLGAQDVTVYAASPDLRRLMLLTGGTVGAEISKRLVRFEPDSGILTPGARIDLPAILDEANVVSDDMRHVISAPRAPMAASDPSTIGGLYDLAGQTPALIGLLPGGQAPTCGVQSFGAAEFVNNIVASGSQHWISRDGNRVFFHTRGGGDCSGASNLYMREGGVSGTSRLISGPPASGPDMGARFLHATPAGDDVFFTTRTRLVTADTNETSDIYRYSIGAGVVCLTCIVGEADVNTPWPGEIDAERIVVSEYGDRLYFTSPRALVPEAPASGLSIYVWRREAPARLGYVGPSAPEGLVSTGGPIAVSSTDGTTLVFWSNRIELNEITRTDNGGFGQYYVYDDGTRELRCVSCAPGRRTSADAVSPLGRAGVVGLDDRRMLTGDGTSFFFVTDEALVARDVNRTQDIYEWHLGEVGLITDGVSPYAEHRLHGVTGDGGEVLFSSHSDLAPGVTELTAQLYVARIGGGFPAPPQPDPTCAGDQCQGQPLVPPVLSTAGTTIHASTDATADAGGMRRARERGTIVRIGEAVAGRGRISVRIAVSGAGRITVSGRKTRRATRTVFRAGTYRLRVALTRRTRRSLRKGRAVRARLRIVFVADAGRATSVTTSVRVTA